jgi:tetratricopeptide (TPR) repeat protein
MGTDEACLVATAEAAEKSGQYDAAFDIWQQIASITNRPDHLCKLGRVAQKLRRWSDAEAALVKASRVDNRFPVPIALLGSLFLARTDGDRLANARQAKVWLERAHAMSPSPMYLSLLGAANDRLGDKEAAEDAFRKVIELDESYVEAYFNLGLLLARDDQNEEAERLLRKATQLDPNSHKAHGQLGVLLQKLGRHSEGEIELRRALEINPTDVIASRHLHGVAGGPDSTN